jgi:cytochrome c oxidase subunit II
MRLIDGEGARSPSFQRLICNDMDMIALMWLCLNAKMLRWYEKRSTIALVAIEWIGVAKAMALTLIKTMKSGAFMNFVLSLLVGLAGFGSKALAASGQPSPWQMNLQEAATPVAKNIAEFHTWLVWLIVAISLFVLALLVLVAVKFNAKSNPVPSQTTHHVGLEIAWTAIPVLILVAIAVPSFRLLKEQIVVPQADLTIKATGYAWYWKFNYPKEAGNFEFETRMLTDEDRADLIKKGKATPEQVPRLLAVDNEVVVPVNKVVQVQVTAGDVLHAFAVPSFGSKVDAVPGRLNQTWFKATKEGIYYGQCSELCGKDHAFMPLAIRVVSEEKYQAWLADAKKKFASNDQEPVQTAETAITAR